MDQFIVTIVVSLFVLAMLPAVILPLVRPEPARPTLVAPRATGPAPAPARRHPGTDTDEPAVAA